MKYLYAVVLSLIVAAQSFAQDIIMQKDGSEIEAKVIKINDAEITYKKWSNPDGPEYTVSKSKIFLIKYANGEKDIINAEPAGNSNVSTAEPAKQIFVERLPAANNRALVASYQPTHVRLSSKVKQSSKKSKYYTPIMSVTDSSVVSTDDIEISFDLVADKNWYGEYYIVIKNKTDKMIYIDKANTFRIFDDGSSESYFNADQISKSKGRSAGVGVGGVLGVVGISGSESTTTTYIQQRILAIPPYSTQRLCTMDDLVTDLGFFGHLKYEYLSIPETWRPCLYKQDAIYGQLKKGGIIQYGEQDSPYKAEYYITYSTDENFGTYSTVKFKLFTKFLIGHAIYYIEYNVEDYIKKVKKILPDFGDDSSLLLGKFYWFSNKK